jgi:RNA polymerase sigma-70 factor (ECF subfamily)
MDEPTVNQANLGMPQQIGLHVPRMYRVAYRMLADADKAHDAVQEACVKALAGLGRFNGRAALATWLHRITVNCATDAIRSETRKDSAHQAHVKQVLHAAGISRRPAPAPRGQAGHGAEAESPGGTPAQQAERRELSDIAWRLLEDLPDDCRLAFALTQIDGYSYDEAAEIEGQPRGTIASRVFRAKKILLEQMNAHIDGSAKS